jgi:hypothetical protein
LVFNSATDTFSLVDDRPRARRPARPTLLIASRHRFVCPVKAQKPGPPVLAVDVIAGREWNGAREVPLLDRYAQLHRSLDALVSDVFPPRFLTRGRG